MKTTNNLLHAQLVELFEQHPYITCFSHDEEGVYFVNVETALHIHYNQVDTIVSNPDKIVINLGNGVAYTVILALDKIEIHLPEMKVDRDITL